MRILFQGDSITDCGRGDHADCRAMGGGYPCLLQADLTLARDDLEVLNGGISGNRVTDLLARWKKDCINLKPDILTILIGVNDVWHELDFGTGVDAALFESVYRLLLQQTAPALPQLKLILMAPFLTPGSAADGARWQKFFDELALRRSAAERLAAEFGAVFIDLQPVFDKACGQLPPSHWTADGVHPTPAGHRLIADTWLAAAASLVEGTI